MYTEGKGIVKPTKALERLALRENEPLRWLLGSILEERAIHKDWSCIPLNFLESQTEWPERYWNQVILQYRTLLANPEDAPRKAKDELNPLAIGFREHLNDFMAEVLAILYLRGKGHTRFRVQHRMDDSTPDFYVISPAGKVPVEVKNLRDTRSADTVLREALIRRTGLAGGKGLNVALVDNSDKFVEDEMADEIGNWVMNELSITPGKHQRTLSDGMTVRLEVYEGAGDLRSVGYVKAYDEGLQAYPDILSRVGRVLRKVLKKPFIKARPLSPAITVIRWAVPTRCLVEAWNLSRKLERDLKRRTASRYPGLDVHVFHNLWNPGIRFPP